MVSQGRGRAGISLLEIMISIGIVGIGLLGVAALIPLAHYKAAEGVREERKALFGKRAYREFFARGFDRPGSFSQGTPYWISTLPNGTYSMIYNGDKIIAQTYCFDPHGIAAQYSHVRFPATLPLPPQFPLIPRITVRSFRPEDFREWLLVHGGNPSLAGPDNISPLALPLPAAEEIFRLRDDVVVETPENINDIARLSYLTENIDRNSPPIASKRVSGGSFSWMATLVPELTSAPNPAVPGAIVPYLTNRYQLSIIVFNQRDLTGSYIEETAAQVDTQNSLLSGPAKEIIIEQFSPLISAAPTSDEQRNVGVRNIRQGDWIALIQKLPIPLPPSAYTYLQWYQVQSTDELESEFAIRRQLSLSGPDWNPNPNPAQPIYAVYVRNVVTVYQKTVELQQ